MKSESTRKHKVLGVANILDKTTALSDCNLNFKLKTHLMMNTDAVGVGLVEDNYKMVQLHQNIITPTV